MGGWKNGLKAVLRNLKMGQGQVVFQSENTKNCCCLLFQVCQWVLAFGMESYITLFMDKTITGSALLNLDSNGLKDLGIKNKEDREKIKKKIKELKAHSEKDKKDMGKKEKLLRKAEKVVGRKK